MRTRLGSLFAVALFAAVLFALFPIGAAQAAGHWTGGVLTNNGVDDLYPHLSSTYLVWAQQSTDGSAWNIRLHEISSGTAKTIATSPKESGHPYLSTAGDYVTIRFKFANTWLLHKISSGSTQVFVPTFGTELAGGPVTDGTWVVWQTTNGDYDIRALSLTSGAGVAVTNDTIDDFLGGMNRGRVVWEQKTSGSRRTVFLYDLTTAERRIIFGEVTDAPAAMYPQVSKDWVGYYDVLAAELCLHRLADGLVIRKNARYGDLASFRLTDDYAFWTQNRPLSPDPRDTGCDLYALDLQTLQTTQLTSDTAGERLAAAQGDRLVYTKSEDGSGTFDLMVVDMGENPVQPYRLAQNVSFSGPAGVADLGAVLSEPVSMCGDYVVASLSDGHDREIAWARWVEDTGAGTGGTGTGGTGGTGTGGTEGTGGTGTGGATFTDVAGSPYETAIYELASREVISGYEDGTYRPTDKVSRQQFAKMMVKALGLAVTGTEVCPFTDVATQIGADPFYPSKYVAVCASHGITTGKTPTTFAPYDDITHQQLITMVARAAALGTPPAAYTPGFSSSQFSLPEHYENARKAAYAGLLDGLQGIGSSYDFLAPSTRGECAQLLYNLLHME